MNQNILQEKSYKFALRIVKLSQYISEEKHEYVISRKVLDSGTSIGVFVEEGRQSDGKVDFAQKFSIANKEAFKTNFWLRILRDSNYITEKLAESLIADREELQKMLIASLKTARRET
jgi:four helix bundle protein